MHFLAILIVFAVYASSHDEVVVINTKSFDECRSQRIRAIAMTAGHRDVVVLVQRGQVIDPALVKISGLGLKSFIEKPFVPDCLHSFSESKISAFAQSAALLVEVNFLRADVAA